MGNAGMDFLSTFGVDLQKFALQGIIFLVPAIWATVRIASNRTGAAVPLWLLLIWFLPLIGAILALIIVRQHKHENRHSQ
jgi:thiol:disulfide interchange protein